MIVHCIDTHTGTWRQALTTPVATTLMPGTQVDCNYIDARWIVIQLYSHCNQLPSPEMFGMYIVHHYCGDRMKQHSAINQINNNRKQQITKPTKYFGFSAKFMAFNWDTHGASLAILPLDAQGDMNILIKHIFFILSHLAYSCVLYRVSKKIFLSSNTNPV